MNGELNPNHSVLLALRDKWPMICAILVRKYAGGRARVTLEDLQRFATEPLAMAARGNINDIELFLVDASQAMDMARKEGGLPA